MLENVHGLRVKIEKKEIEITDETDAQAIIEQSLAVGTEVKSGDEITLYIPEIIEEYPDFVGEDWTVADVQAFCDKNNINLSIVYEETNLHAPGKIMKQSRTGKIVSGVSLKITVAKEIPLPPEIKPEEDNKTDDGKDDNPSTEEDN